MKKLLIITLLLAVGILTIMTPVGFRSPDVAFHLGKILRAGYGEYFLDPYSGIPSIYPSLFHFLWGAINVLTHFDPFILAKIISISTLLGIFLSTFVLAKIVLKNTSAASLATLCVGLVFYSPTGKLVLLTEPGNFSIAFLLFGIALIYRYCESQLSEGKKLLLLLGGLLLLSVSINMWWYHTILVGIFLVCVLIFLAKHSLLRLSHVVLGLIIFLLPFSFTLIHFYSVHASYADYLRGNNAMVRAPGWESIILGIRVLIDKGNSGFAKYLLPMADVSITSVIQTLIFYGLYIPVNLILLIGGFFEFFRKYQPSKRNDLQRILLYTAFITFLGSILSLLLIADDGSRIKRVHFTGSILLLIYYWPIIINKCGKRILYMIAVTASLAILLTSFYSPKPKYFLKLDDVVPPSTREVIAFIESHQTTQGERIFLLEDSLQELIPYVHTDGFNSNTEISATLLQNRNAVKPIINAYSILQAHRSTDEVKGMLYSFKVKYLVFKYNRNVQEKESADYYAQLGTTVFSNDAWIIIEPK